MSSINSLVYIEGRQSHAVSDITQKNMINSFEEIHTRDNGVFLQWDFKTLRSEYHKDLSVKEGSISFDNGQVILAPRTTLMYPINQYYPTKNFMIKVLFLDKVDTNFEFVLGTLSNPGTSFTINPLVTAHSLLYNFELSEFDLFPQIENYHTHAAFLSLQENEFVMVVDNDVYHEVSIWLNGVKVAFNSFEHTKEIQLLVNDTLKLQTFGGLTMNQFVLYDKIPIEY